MSSSSQSPPGALEFRPGARIVEAFVLFCRAILGAWKGRRLPKVTGAFKLGSSFIRSRMLSGNTVSLDHESDRGFLVFGPVTIRT